MTPRFLPVACAVALLASACSTLVGITDVAFYDASADAPDAVADTPAADTHTADAGAHDASPDASGDAPVTDALQDAKRDAGQ